MRIREIEENEGRQIRPDEIMNISPKHDGHCYKNSNLQPAVAEEYQASKMGKLLLSAGDDSDIYLADKISIFGMDISTDGDTRGVNNFIRIQNQIIGEKADNMADNSPDVGHTIKCNNNALFDLKKNDKTLSGVDLLNSSRIKSINSDTRHIIPLSCTTNKACFVYDHSSYL